ncbi:hypothetical protein QP141_03485 [Alloscardovia omnicolens]|uniref:Uncharacterized protein n=1 Tax=Alloscardovia omnicolens TaxID=419015 RepID=A0A2I1M383_9BIFI|nr:hypothetical protein [Alloscardovia omnicolens]MDK6249504.1 hypothetical protein [Alloscardovia omnicolens]MDK6251724.1 hypothetical protein [Alloscardovia omnicolens]MDU6533525.1 hypothetical protein [Alloscardovia omnicolens]PKZ14591.1 hypothetical protein CYJ32_06550 [Alloscardovia omnicolens]
MTIKALWKVLHPKLNLPTGRNAMIRTSGGIVLIVEDGVISLVEIKAQYLQDDLHFNAERLPQGITFFPNTRHRKSIPRQIDPAKFSSSFESVINSNKHKIVSLSYTNAGGHVYLWSPNGYSQLK